MYCFDEIDRIDETVYGKLSDYCSKERREKTKRYRFMKDRVQSIFSYFLLKIAVYEEYGLKTLPTWGIDSNHKPIFLEQSDIYFNLSHCINAVACCVSNYEVGVDIQEIT